MWQRNPNSPPEQRSKYDRAILSITYYGVMLCAVLFHWWGVVARIHGVVRPSADGTKMNLVNAEALERPQTLRIHAIHPSEAGVVEETDPRRGNGDGRCGQVSL